MSDPSVVAERIKAVRREPRTAADPSSSSSSGKPASAAAQRGRTANAELKGFTGLTGVQILYLVAGLVTAPLVARALGADGRGLLAAVAVPLGLGAHFLELGLPLFGIRNAAKGVSPRLVFGSLALPLLVVSGLVALQAPLIASLISADRQPVDQYLTIGLRLMPIVVLTALALDIAWGLANWRVLTLGRSLPPLVILVGVVTLDIMGELTLETAVAITIASSLIPILAVIPLLPDLLPPHLDLRFLRRGLGFGIRGWFGTLGNLVNMRLDQLLMIPLVTPRELGVYAVAVTISSLCNVFTSQVIPVLLPRIADGESHLLPQAVRCVFLVVVGTGALIALATHLFLVPLFGPDFSAAVPLVFVLLGATVWQAGVGALSLALPALNRPGAPSIGEFIALAITVPGLILLLPQLGAMGAALVSLAAYATTFGVLLAITTRHLGQRPPDYLIPRRADLAMLGGLALSFPRALAARRAPA